ncbi:hypothetical protein H4R18_003895 [Coemansia javaensis]|uniref:Thioredoxin-like fold domain-containing protein n=1 Tax=Coemansia javaensis TaxID=2761396 RepID=A0A9W8HCD1_9FUNG|nr:hypothetical protein H4R18_003895 [Coemansia javaensis]
MALAPAYAAHRILAGPRHTLEVFLDYTCPFSARLWRTLRGAVTPLLEARGVAVVFRHQVQPWHPTSALLHEAALAVERLSPARFALFCDALFEHQREFFDEATVDMTRGDVYRRLADLAAGANAVDDRQALLQLVDVQASDEPANRGNAVTADLKYHIRLARAQGIHVSPTVVLDGVRDDAVSSSWGAEQWQAWLDQKLAVVVG